MSSTKAEILAAALARADRYGLDSVTVTGITSELGITAPALYKHFTGTTGLVHEMKKVALCDLRTALADSVIGQSHASAVRALAVAFREFATAHPGRYALTVAAEPRDPELSELGLRVVQVVVKILAAFGLASDDNIHTVRILRATLHGFVSIEHAGGFGLPASVDATFERLVEGLIVHINSASAAKAEPQRRS